MLFTLRLPLNLAVSGLERYLEKTGSSIASRFFAGYSARVEQVGQCLKCRKIAMLCEGWMNVFLIDFGRVGFGAPPRGNRK